MRMIRERSNQPDNDRRQGRSKLRVPLFQCLIFNFSFLIPFAGQAQSFTVKGSAPNFIGKEIRLMVQDDPISGKEVLLAKTKVGTDGSFSLSGSVEPVQYGFLQIDRECGDLFLQGGKSVVVRFAPLKRPKGPEAFSDRYFFQLDIIEGEGAKLNREISLFNARLDGFLENLYPLLKKGKNPKLIADSVAAFKLKTDAEFATSQAFAKQYMFYALGNLELTFVSKRKILFDRYLKGREAQPNNPEYIRFINQFFEGQVERMALIDKREECIAILKKSSAFAALEQLLLSDPFLQDVFIRRAILIQGMEKLFGQKGFDDNRVSATLREFSKLSSNSDLIKAANNIADRKDGLRANTQAPDFSLTDTEGKVYRLSDFKGKYLLLEITDAANAYSQQESSVLRDMLKRFPRVKFFTVCLGNTEKEVSNYKQLFAPNRPVCSIARTHKMVSDYQIVSLPGFFLIGPDGRFYRSPALDPSKGGISELEVLHAKIEGKGKVGE